MNKEEIYQIQKEYKETKERYDKLHKMIIKYKAGTLDFKPSCKLELLEERAKYMDMYLKVLEIRAEIENVDLEGEYNE